MHESRFKRAPLVRSQTIINGLPDSICAVVRIGHGRVISALDIDIQEASLVLIGPRGWIALSSRVDELIHRAC